MAGEDLGAAWMKFFEDAGIPSNVSLQYSKVFTDNRMKLTMLSDLNKEILKELGVHAVGDIIAILKHSKNLVAQQSKKERLTSVQKKVKVATNAPVSRAEKRKRSDDTSTSTTLKKFRPASHLKDFSGGNESDRTVVSRLDTPQAGGRMAKRLLKKSVKLSATCSEATTHQMNLSRDLSKSVVLVDAGSGFVRKFVRSGTSADGKTSWFRCSGCHKWNRKHRSAMKEVYIKMVDGQMVPSKSSKQLHHPECRPVSRNVAVAEQADRKAR